MSGCEKMVIKLSLGSGLRCSSVDEARCIVCCLREEQTLARKKPKKKDSDAVDEKQNHLSHRQLHSQMSQDRQAGCSYLILSVFCWLYFCSDYPQVKNKSQNENLFHCWAF